MHIARITFTLFVSMMFTNLLGQSPNIADFFPQGEAPQLSPEEEKAFLEFMEILAQEIEKEEQRRSMGAQPSNQTTQPEVKAQPRTPQKTLAPAITKNARSATNEDLLRPGDKKFNFLASFLPPAISGPQTVEEKKQTAKLPRLQKQALMWYLEKIRMRLVAIDGRITSISPLKRQFFADLFKESTGRPAGFHNLLANAISLITIITTKSSYRRALYDPAFAVLRDRIVHYVETIKPILEQVALEQDPNAPLSLSARAQLARLANILGHDLPLLVEELQRVMEFSSKSIEEKRTIRARRYQQVQQRLERERSMARREQQYRNQRSNFGPRNNSPWSRSAQRYPGNTNNRGGYYYDPGMFSYGGYPGWYDHEEEQQRPANSAPPAAGEKASPEKKTPEKPSEKQQLFINLVSELEKILKKAQSTKDIHEKEELLEKAQKLYSDAESTERSLDPKNPLTAKTHAALGRAHEAIKKLRATIPKKPTPSEEEGKKPPIEEPIRKPEESSTPEEEPKPEPKPVTPPHFATYNSTAIATYPLLPLQKAGAPGTRNGSLAAYNALCMVVADPEIQFTPQAMSNEELFDVWQQRWQEILNNTAHVTAQAMQSLIAQALDAVGKKELINQFIVLDTSTINAQNEFFADMLYELAQQRKIADLLSEQKRIACVVNTAQNQESPAWIVIVLGKSNGAIEYTVADSYGQAPLHLLSAEALCYGIMHHDVLTRRAHIIALQAELRLITNNTIGLVQDQIANKTFDAELFSKGICERYDLLKSVFATIASAPLNSYATRIQQALQACTEQTEQTHDRDALIKLAQTLMETASYVQDVLNSIITEEHVRRYAYVRLINRGEVSYADMLADGISLTYTTSKQPVFVTPALNNVLKQNAPTLWDIALENAEQLLVVMGNAQFVLSECTLGGVYMTSPTYLGNISYMLCSQQVRQQAQLSQGLLLDLLQPIIGMLRINDASLDDNESLAAVYVHIYDRLIHARYRANIERCSIALLDLISMLSPVRNYEATSILCFEMLHAIMHTLHERLNTLESPVEKTPETIRTFLKQITKSLQAATSAAGNAMLYELGMNTSESAQILYQNRSAQDVSNALDALKQGLEELRAAKQHVLSLDDRIKMLKSTLTAGARRIEARGSHFMEDNFDATKKRLTVLIDSLIADLNERAQQAERPQLLQELKEIQVLKHKIFLMPQKEHSEA